MPTYNYICRKCEKATIRKYGDPSIKQYEDLIIFETSHMMNPTDKELSEAVICPRCNNTDCYKTMMGTNTRSYILGYGYLDKAGAKRDMAVFHLTQHDPYGYMRESGEADNMADGFRKANKHDPKSMVFDMSMTEAVKEAVNKPSQ